MPDTAPPPALDIAVVSACNSEQVLAHNLARSPMLAQVPLHTEWGAPSAAAALNRGLDATTADIVVLAHQDVYFPRGWDALLRARIAEVAARDPDWALIGPFGVGLDERHHGPVWSSSIGMVIGRVALAPVPVQSFDEMVIVLRRSSGLRFDEAMGGWHMYGTDIVTQARARGLGAWVTALPCVHNDRFHGVLGPDFAESYGAMQRKWAGRLPLRTPVIQITRSGSDLYRWRWRTWRGKGFMRTMAVGTDTPAEDLALRCGWGDLASAG